MSVGSKRSADFVVSVTEDSTTQVDIDTITIAGEFESWFADATIDSASGSEGSETVLGAWTWAIARSRDTSNRSVRVRSTDFSGCALSANLVLSVPFSSALVQPHWNVANGVISEYASIVDAESIDLTNIEEARAVEEFFTEFTVTF